MLDNCPRFVSSKACRSHENTKIHQTNSLNMSSNLLLPVLFLPQDSRATDGNISEGQARIAFATVCLGLQAKRQKSRLREIVISLENRPVYLPLTLGWLKMSNEHNLIFIPFIRPSLQLWMITILFVICSERQLIVDLLRDSLNVSLSVVTDRQ